MKAVTGEDALVFKRIESPQPVTEYLLEAIKSRLLAGQKVLWLIAGGSAIKIGCDVAKKLSENNHLNNLTVSLTDERFGKVGHADSNWRQLIDVGFALPGANLWPVLNGDSLNGAADRYSKFLSDEVSESDYSIALAGIGADGHIFGIKPGSPALDTTEKVVGYKWDDYVRLTPTYEMLKELDEIVVYATGSDKHLQFDRLGQ